jgi:hypothetical protein
MIITVPNRAPTANAGTAQTILWANRNTVTLTGSGTDPDGDTLTYTWTQTGGTTVTLNGANTASPYFTMASPGTYTFSLTVNDGEVSSGASTTTATNSTATYTTGWEGNSMNDSGGLTWTKASSNAGENGIDTSEKKSGSYGYHMQSCNSGSCSSYAKVINYAGRYVYSVSYWVMQPVLENAPRGAAGLFEGETQRVSYTGNNSWTQYSWTANKIVTDLNFRINGPGTSIGGRGNMHIDDISVTLWN